MFFLSHQGNVIKLIVALVEGYPPLIPLLQRGTINLGFVHYCGIYKK
jgi:hypothetical protein